MPNPDVKSEDLYSVLGVSKDTSPDTIRKVFRKLARQYHPDKRQDLDDDTAFKSIKEAHEVLTDQQRRGLYDATGFKSQEELMANSPPNSPLNPPSSMHGWHPGSGPPSPGGGFPGWPEPMMIPPPWEHPGGLDDFLSIHFEDFLIK